MSKNIGTPEPAHPDSATPSGDGGESATSGEIEGLVELSRKATQGEWSTFVNRLVGDEDEDGWSTIAETPAPASPTGSARRRQWEIDAAFIATLVNAYRSGRLVSRPTPPDLIQAAREAGTEVDDQVWAAAAELNAAQHAQPAWLWFDDWEGHGASVDRLCKSPVQAPYVRADIALRSLQTPHQGLEDGRRPEDAIRRELDHNIHFAAVSILDWMMCEGLMRHRTAEDDGLKIEEMIRSALSFQDQPHPDPTTGGEAPGRDEQSERFIAESDALEREEIEARRLFKADPGAPMIEWERLWPEAKAKYRALAKSASPRSSQKEEGV